MAAVPGGHVTRRRLGIKMVNDSGDYVRFDERTNVLASLELLKLVLPLLRHDMLLWKWAIIGAHDALQGALVCALQDTSRTSVMAERAAKQVIRWHNRQESGEYPNDRLAEFGPLLERCLDAKLVNTSPEQVEKIRRLHAELRNQFSHFRPMGWSIETAGLPRIIKAAIDMASDLMRTENVAIHLDEHAMVPFDAAFAVIRTQLDSL